jgi:hypothetical protein
MAAEQKYQDLFTQLKREIKMYDDKLQALSRFRDMVVNSEREGLFDKEDMSWIEDDIENVRTERDKRQAEYERRKELYENSIVKMENILQKRKLVFDQADSKFGVLQQRPDLLKKFAEKQATLMTTVKQAKVELQQPLKL